MDKTHEEFIEEVKDASSLPAQTCRALGPESEEDISMYANDSQQVNPIISDGRISKAGRVDRLKSDQSSIESKAAPADTQTISERLKDGKGKVPHMSAMSGAKQEEAQNMIQKLKDNGQEEFLSRLTFS